MSKQAHIVAIHGGKPTTTTLIIAEKFGKKHKNVLRDVRAIMADCPEEFNRLNFELRFEKNELQNGQPSPYYELTEKAFALLAMGYNGPIFMGMKIAFLEEFSRLRNGGAVAAILPEAARTELLLARPLWAKIARYKGMRLTHPEIALLCGWRDIKTVSKHLRRMEACGILKAPANLARMRELANANLKRGAALSHLRVVGGAS